MRCLLFLSLFSTLACSSSPPQEPKAAEPVAISPPSPTAPQSNPAATSTPAPKVAETNPAQGTQTDDGPKPLHPANTLPGHKTPRPGPQLGSPCDRTDTTHCGKSGRVAVQRNESHSMAMRSNMPCTLSHVSSNQAGFSFRACVAEGQVYASGECVMCRMMGAGWSAIGDIDEMTIAQSRDLQKRLGLPAKPVLRSEAAWKAAIANAASRMKR